MDSTGDCHGSECTTGSMMLLDPCLLLAPATWGSQLGCRGGKGRLVTTVSAALSLPPAAPGVPEGVWAASCRPALLQPQ